MAIRTYPIRVAGNSGPLPNEITWEEVQEASGYPCPIAEFTTTTNRLRRVAKFDWSVVDQAVAANSPTRIAQHGGDYIDFANYSVTDWNRLTRRLQKFVRRIERRYRVPVSFIGTGTANEHIVDRRDTDSLWTTDGLRSLRPTSLVNVTKGNS